jgi:hypothetical protein
VGVRRRERASAQAATGADAQGVDQWKPGGRQRVLSSAAHNECLLTVQTRVNQLPLFS